MRRLDWRAWPAQFAGLWRSSLQMRTVAITILLSGLAVAVIGGYISFSLGTNLFEARRTVVESASANATVAGQQTFDGATDQGGSETIEDVTTNALDVILRSAGTTRLALLRSPGQDGPVAPSNRSYGPLGSNTESLITDDLRSSVRDSAQPRTHSQSVLLPADDAPARPGLVVGSQLSIRGIQYELYVVYDLAAVQETLDTVQRTLLLGGLALIVLIGAVTYVVVRLVVAPVQVAAETSEKLAAGELEVRIPVKGDDVIATLGRSFNGMAAALQSQITRLASLSQVQQRFVSDVSHELRTPLTTIRLAGDVLYDQRESFTPETARTAELLHTQVERFELLLADLLEMSRYDAGAVDMEVEPTNLVRLVEDAIDSVRSLAATKDTPVSLHAPGGYFEAEVDSRRIRRILLNLLGNAIDHGEGHPIVVWVDSDQRAVAIAVRDYGVGMSAASMLRVFDRFWRADPSRQRVTGGTGLGLAISLEDAVLHGGWLEVWSELGAGSCFRLTLPRARGGILVSSPLDLPPDDDSASGPVPGAEPERTSARTSEPPADDGGDHDASIEPVEPAAPAMKRRPAAKAPRRPDEPRSTDA